MTEVERPHANPLSPAWFSERMKQEKEARAREAFGVFEDDFVEVRTESGRPYLVQVSDPSDPESTTFTDDEGITNTGRSSWERGWSAYPDSTNAIRAVSEAQEQFASYQNLLDRINTVTFEDEAMEVFDEAFDLMVARQKKYGPGNIEILGQYGVFTRMEDKMERIRRSFNGQIVNGQIVLDEPVEHTDDTLDDADLDLMNYAAIRLIHRRGKWGKPMADEVKAKA